MATHQLSGDTTVNDLGHISRSLDCFISNFSKTVCDIRQKLLQATNRKSYTSYRLVPLLMTLKYIWRSFQPRLSFHVHFSYPWYAFASHGLPAIAELLVLSSTTLCFWENYRFAFYNNLQCIIIILLEFCIIIICKKSQRKTCKFKQDFSVRNWLPGTLRFFRTSVLALDVVLCLRLQRLIE